MKVVIIGNGIAGNEVAFALREADRDCEIIILSAETFPEYDPCALPYFVGDEVMREVVFRKKQEEYAENNINLVLDNRVTAIDPDTGKVVTQQGTEFTYDKLVLAHGGSLFVPPIEGIDKKGVLSCKTLEQADKLHQHDGSSAVVIGSGAIGIEAAEALKRKGYAVTIIELLDWIMPTLFDEPAARRLEQGLAENGIDVLTQEKVVRLEGREQVEAVHTDKRVIACDTVVVATGVVPGRALAESAGIEVNRGILVDERMETSVSDIYSCGDCAETFDAITGERCMYQLKHNAIEQARIVARNILGENVSYRGAYPFARAHFFNTHSVSFGKTLKTLDEVSEVEVVEKTSGNDYLRLILREGKLLGVQAVGDYSQYTGVLMGAMWRGDDFAQIRSEWKKIAQLGSPYPWQYRILGRLLGLSSQDAPGGLQVCYSAMARS